MLSRSIWSIFLNWVKRIYQRTWGREEEFGANLVSPTFLLYLDKWKAVTWAGVISLQTQTFPQVCSIAWIGQKGVCKRELVPESKLCSLIWHYHKQGQAFDSLSPEFVVLFLSWFRKWTKRRSVISWASSKPQHQPRQQGLRGSARMLNGFLCSSLSHK